MSLNITLDVNGKTIRKIRAWNCHPEVILGNYEGDCPYQILDDLTEEKFFVSHSRSDGAAVLAQKALDRIIEHELEMKWELK